MAKLPRICMISDHGCIRVFKEAVALVKRGYTVDLLARKLTFGFNRFNTAQIYFDKEHLQKAVELSSADIFHVHNEPNWMVAAAKEVTDRPVIYDVHDMTSLRFDEEPDEHERSAFEVSDGAIFISEACQEIGVAKHGLKQPTIVLRPWMNEEFVPKEYGDVSWTSLVYEGGVTTQPYFYSENGHQPVPHYRYYLDIVKAFVKQGFNVHIFSAFMQEDLTYESAGAVMAYNLPYPTMLRALRPFGFGLVGAPVSNKLMESASPNKLQEYISQGVVPIVWNAAECARWCEEYGVGIRLDGLDNLAEQLEPGPDLRENVIKRRHEFTMEKHIGPLCQLYDEVL